MSNGQVYCYIITRNVQFVHSLHNNFANINIWVHVQFLDVSVKYAYTNVYEHSLDSLTYSTTIQQVFND